MVQPGIGTMDVCTCLYMISGRRRNGYPTGDVPGERAAFHNRNKRIYACTYTSNTISDRNLYRRFRLEAIFPFSISRSFHINSYLRNCFCDLFSKVFETFSNISKLIAEKRVFLVTSVIM